MIIEITSAADFLVHILRSSSSTMKLNEAQLAMFRGSLSNILVNRYREHWFPQKPNKGSGYRCITIDGKLDPIIAQAGAANGIHPEFLRTLFPIELTLWIDPAEVSYRIGENGSICVLYESTNYESMNTPPPHQQSPELYHDPRQYGQIDPRQYGQFNQSAGLYHDPRQYGQFNQSAGLYHDPRQYGQFNQSAGLYHDPRQYGQINPLVDYVGVNYWSPY